MLVAPLASALTLNTPTNVNNGERVDITWTAVPTDVYVDQHLPFFPSHGVSSPFTLELVNPVFNSQFAIANNVDPADGSRTWQVPTVPVGYVMESCNVYSISEFLLVPTMSSTLVTSSTFPTFMLRPANLQLVHFPPALALLPPV